MLVRCPGSQVVVPCPGPVSESSSSRLGQPCVPAQLNSSARASCLPKLSALLAALCRLDLRFKDLLSFLFPSPECGCVRGR